MQLKISKVKKVERSLRARDRGYDAKARIYVWPEGESVIENLMNRRTRPYNDYRKLIEAAGILPEGAKMNWSRTAGCGCGCSPGFILSRTVWNENHRPIDFHLTVVEAD